MTHTYTQLIYQLVWSTKEREALIPPIFQERLYQYMGGTLRQHHAVCLEIDGVEDHVHILAGIPPSVAIAKLIREVKVSSSKWLQRDVLGGRSFAWQEGYGAFSVSRSHMGPIAEYIQNQEQHHKSTSFKDEFLTLLRKNGVEFDERYLWK